MAELNPKSVSFSFFINYQIQIFFKNSEKSLETNKLPKYY